MEYRDLESGTISSKSFNIRRQWHKIPRAIRLYTVLAGIFFVSFLLFYSFGKPFSNEINSENGFKNDIQKISTEVAIRQVQTSLPVLELVDSRKSTNTDLKNENNLSPITELNSDVWKSIKLNDQQIKIKNAIKHSWDGYRKYAWGRDHLKPNSKGGDDWFGVGLTILDSLDTLLIAGMTEEFNEGLNWVRESLTFEKDTNVNCFETTIRALGGLLSAYHITGDKILLEKAQDLGDRLIHCFDSQSKVPLSDVNLKTKRARPPKWVVDSSLSEVSSMQIEFRDLTYETKNKIYEEKSYDTSKHIHSLVVDRGDPLLPMFINPTTGRLGQSIITLGARADSYYEYLYKQYLQVKDKFLLDDWMDAVDKINEKLYRKTVGKLKLGFIGEIYKTEDFSPKMDHLVCFLSGTLALSYYHQMKQIDSFRGHIVEVSQPNQKLSMHLEMAEELARTCHFMYNLTETGLAPEIGYFGYTENDREEFIIRPADSHNLLRPEFVESLFFLYHITGKEIYREWGKQVFYAFEKYSKVSTGGYSALNDVRTIGKAKQRDKMDSFWIAETLKYLFLLFTDDKRVIDAILNRYIFNTEGHIFPRRVF